MEDQLALQLRKLLVSHALDDGCLCSSDDESCSPRSNIGSPRIASSPSGRSVPTLQSDTSRDDADILAFVQGPDQLKESQKSAQITSKRSSRPESTNAAPAISTTGSTPPSPAKPLKWLTRLADRSTASVNLEAHYQVPPHLLFDLLADPFQHERIFDAIEAADAELLEEDGPRRKWRLDYTARWNFWKVSGICENRMLMWTDRDAGTVTFKLREPGFLRKYEGTWTIKPACGTPLSDCYASSSCPSSVVTSYSSSPSSSRSSSPPGTPRAAAAPAGPWASPGSSSSSGIVNSWSSTSPSGSGSSSSMRLAVAPVASVNAASGLTGLTGAVAAIARMQAVWQESVHNSMANFSSLSSQVPQQLVPQIPVVGQAFQQIRASPWAQGLTASLAAAGIGSRPLGSSGGSSNDSGSGRERRPRRPLPTAAIITAETLTSPKISPPYPLNQALKVQSKGQVEDMLEGLVRAAATAAQLQATPLQVQ